MALTWCLHSDQQRRPETEPGHYLIDKFEIFGGRTRTRTLDPLIKSQLLYQLSYAPGSTGGSAAKPRCLSKGRPPCPASRTSASRGNPKKKAGPAGPRKSRQVEARRLGLRRGSRAGGARRYPQPTSRWRPLTAGPSRPDGRNADRGGGASRPCRAGRDRGASRDGHHRSDCQGAPAS